jgi:hypothetical protein
MGWNCISLRPLTELLFIPQIAYVSMVSQWNGIDRKTEQLEEKPVLVPLYLQQILHELTRTRIWASAVGENDLSK